MNISLIFYRHIRGVLICKHLHPLHFKSKKTFIDHNIGLGVFDIKLYFLTDFKEGSQFALFVCIYIFCMFTDIFVNINGFKKKIVFFYDSLNVSLLTRIIAKPKKN